MRSLRIGNPSGSNDRMGLMIAWEVCQVLANHILNGKSRLNLKRIQEAQVRTCCRTCESNRCVCVVLRIRVGLMLEWDSRSYGRIQEAQVRTCCRTSESNGCVRVVLGIRVGLSSIGTRDRMGGMRSRCIGYPSGSNGRMGLVITWELCQFMSKHILMGKRRLNLKRIQEAQVRTCCRTSESNGCVCVVLGIRVGLMVEWDS
ncbi:uncharacterized protein G2W53_010041 [Senna tora]|uniref:Uncharacterized protein n=1 Tax=Senna tora TaxID=362788 RepID=A0A834X075_9FABA|nr:uncharacterized protein G2W53_010041 [Senna tora]